MKTGIKAIFTHFFVLILFIIVALAYFYPVLQGKAIFQSDIVQYTGMAREQSEFRDKTASEPYWTNSAFGGMPTYQLGANYPHDYIKKLDRVIRFLPRPADYLFLYFLGFYILLCCLKVDFRLAVLGALAFGFSTYLIIILGVGHNAKAHAIGYLPMILGGIVLVFRKMYILGFALTALAMALEIGANHYQMTYYFMLLVLVLGLVYLVYSIREKEFKHFFTSVGILLFAVLLGIGVNATSILATKEYADWSTRGKSDLTIKPDGSPRNNADGLDRQYITQYSYGIAESLNLFVPRLFGGSNSENLGTDSKSYTYLTEQGLSRARALEFSSGLPLYWGKQPGVAAPAYIGAIICFLFVLGLFLVKGKYKWWLVGGTVLSLLLSWGKNFGLLTDFMIDYFPLYDKFRAVSSIQVILELCVPLLAILGLKELLKTDTPVTAKLRALKFSFLIAFGLGVLLLLGKGLFDFNGLNDATYLQYFGDEIMAMIKRDREAVYVNDTIRSMILVILAALLLWLYAKGRLGRNLMLLILGVLVLWDLVGIDWRYVNENDFVRQREMSAPFAPTNLDKEISEDPDIFRVYDPAEGLNGARTSYFHQSIGGYHAAKPAGMQALFDFHLYNNHLEVLNMLNVKYVVQKDEDGKVFGSVNTQANGNAWFVDALIPVSNADRELLILDSLDTQRQAVVNTQLFPQKISRSFERDTTATIRLTDYQPNHLSYESSNSHPGLAVFSEMYYPNGWMSFIDGREVPHFRVDYVLRAMEIPAGSHSIEFRFVPRVVKTGSNISLASSILLIILILGGLFYKLRTIPDKKATG